MKSASVAGIALLATLSGCCSHWVDIETFRQSPLQQQIREYERGLRERCIPREGKGLLVAAIAGHGLESAEAMTELLRHPSPLFPLEDAVEVLELVHIGGTDLRNHESMRALATLADTASSPEVRARAKEAFEAIQTHKPGELLRRPRISGLQPLFSR
jgi:hypothetical protein